MKKIKEEYYCDYCKVNIENDKVITIDVGHNRIKHLHAGCLMEIKNAISFVGLDFEDFIEESLVE